MADPLLIAGVQMDVRLMDCEANLQRMLSALEETAAKGAALTVFPECSLTGYCFESLSEARPFAETIPGPSTERFVEACQRLNTMAIYGLLEPEGDALFNACVLVGPDGIVGSYRKIHLPYLGIDRFTSAGQQPFSVHETDSVQIGMNICYDSAFPESARVMSLAGADLIALPTNFPPGSECMVGHVINARAMENAVYYIAVNRAGNERGFRFIGGSKICDTNGNILDQADHDGEAIIYGEIDVDMARNKQRVRVPDKHVIHRFQDRRPEMYKTIAESDTHT